MSQQKTCKQCSAEFIIEDEDLAFYKKISPTFDGKTFEIPPPELCPQCRIRTKLAFRNESKFFKIESALSGKSLISQCSPECRFTIYGQDEWDSDAWDPMEYGRDFDPSKPFLKQLEELNLSVPMPHASLAPDNENSKFIGNASGAKDCYLISNSTGAEKCMYGVGLWRSKDCVDCYKIYNCENCYEVTIGYNSYSCFYSQNIHNCSESYFLDSCVGCRNCFGCANLNNKQYWAYNKPSSKEEIEKIISDFSSSSEKRLQIAQKAKNFIKDQPKKFSQISSSDDSTGNYLDHCKNVKESFFVTEAENVKYSTNLSESSKDIFDCCFVGMRMDKVYQAVTVGLGVSNLISCSYVYSDCGNIFYSVYCIHGCNDLFGCVGLRHKQYCVLNKQYSKEDYEKLVARIVEHMQKTGEWGQFLPISFSHFGYNDSLASYFFPISKEEAKKINANWTEGNYNLKFEGEFYTPSELISTYNPKKNPKAEAEIQKALAGTLKCKETARPFKIISAEIIFYIRNNLPLPEIHPEVRQSKRFLLCNRFKLYTRQCMCEEQGHNHEGRCKNEFETTYAPDRPERVYCEKCYQKAVL
jgi:hypothetical protein